MTPSLDLFVAWMDVSDEVNSLFLSPLESLMELSCFLSSGERSTSVQPGANSQVPVAFGDAEFSSFKATEVLEYLTELSDTTETARLKSSNGFDHLLRILNELVIMLI